MGYQGIWSDDIPVITSKDEVAVQILSFVQVTNSVLAKYEPR